MSYTWEDVMLSIDVKDEAKREQKQQQDILDKQVEEETAMGYWSLGLSLIGGALFGPAGYVAGKIAGRGIGDIRNTWETDVVDVGKFDKDAAEEFKKTRDKAVTDQNTGQILNAVTDLATMYVQAGGLKEGFEGWSDLTTFGTGEDAWTAFSDESWLSKIPGVSTLPEGQTLFTGGYKTPGSLADVGNYLTGGKGDGDVGFGRTESGSPISWKGPGGTVSSVGQNLSPVDRLITG